MATASFIDECRKRVNKNRLGKIIIPEMDKIITGSDILQKFTIDSGCYSNGDIIGSVYVKCLKADFVSNIADLNGKNIEVKVGVKYDDSSVEYINMGKYTIERPNNEITASMSQFTAYDSLYEKIDDKYVCGIDYSSGNKTLKDLYIDVCTQLGLTPRTTDILNGNICILDNPFTNGEKNRIVLQTVAKISCSFVDIDVDTNQIDLCWLNSNEEPDYTFYKNDYVNVIGGQIVCGPINCLIIKNSQIDDENVTIKDEESINLYGEHSIVISEDYILHNAELREQAIIDIWNRVKNLKYVDCELTTYYGKPFLKNGNRIRVYISDNDYFDTYVLKHQFEFDGAMSSIIKSPVLTNQEIRKKQDISLQERLRNTQIDLNKQKHYIEDLITDVYEEDGLINENFTKIYRDINGINNSVQKSGGNNLIRNSVMFAYDSYGVPTDWTLSETGILEISSSAESLNNGCLSGNVFILNNKTVSQRITVKMDSEDIPEDKKIYYTFSTRIKKGAYGTCYVKLYNDNEEHLIELASGDEAYYDEFEIQAILPKDNYLILEFFGSEGSNATFTDNMLAVGNYKTQWQQANGEIMNNQVNIDPNGVLVKSSIYDGDYTVMSPLEFAGYSKINGQIVKVFSLNKDTTRVKKLDVEDEIRMDPIKIVPRTSGEWQGWAFVPSTKG